MPLPLQDSQEGMLSEVLSEQEVLTTIAEDNNLDLPEPINVKCESSSDDGSSLVVEQSVCEPSVAETVTVVQSVPSSVLTNTVAPVPAGLFVNPASLVTSNTSSASVAAVPVRLKSYSGPSAKSVAITGGVRNIKPVNSVTIGNNSNLPKSVSIFPLSYFL